MSLPSLWRLSPLAAALLIGSQAHALELPPQVVTGNPLGSEQLASPTTVLEGDDLGLQFQGVGFRADQQGGGERRQAPQGGEGHRTFLGKTTKRLETYSYNITSLFRRGRELFLPARAE